MKRTLVILLSVFYFAFAGFTQTTAQHDVIISIDPVAMVGLSENKSIELSPGSPSIPGNQIDFNSTSSTDNTLWLNYSVIVTENNKYKVSVSMVGEVLPNDVSIGLNVSNYNGTGAGVLGTTKSTQTILLNNNDETIVDNIGSCYTGIGSSNGHNLEYSLIYSGGGDYGDFVNESYTKTITYTILEQ